MATQRRMIHAQLTENKKFASMSDKAQITYIFLIVLADDDGRLKGDSEWLKIKIFPYDAVMTIVDMKKCIKEITKAGLIIWYKDNDGNYFIAHPNWKKYQTLRPDRKKNSNIPPSNDGQVSVISPHKLSKLSKLKEYNSISFLSAIPEKDLEVFYNRFDCSKKAIISKAEDLLLWCNTNGRVKKNYKTFLLNALKKDFPERKEPIRKFKFIKGKTKVDVFKKAIPIPEDIKRSIKKIIGNKQIKTNEKNK